MSKPTFYVASDYAGIDFEGGAFYYGYEHSICAECGEKNNGANCDKCEDADRYWCFTGAMPGYDEMVVIPFNKLGTDDMFNVVENLNVGIGWLMSKHESLFMR